jgi:HEAT repeat protein
VEFRRTYPVPIDELDDGPDRLPLLHADSAYFKRTIPSFALDAGIEAIRGNAIIALGNSGDPVAVEGLGFTLRHGIPQNRVYSAWALGRIGGRRARGVLQRALKEEDERSVIAEITRELDSASG